MTDILARYAHLLEAALAGVSSFQPTAEEADAVQVERAMCYALCVNSAAGNRVAGSVDRLLAIAASADAHRVGVVDRFGHRRPVYRPVLVYAWCQAFHLGKGSLPSGEGERWRRGIGSWIETLPAPSSDFTALRIGNAVPAARGGEATAAVWAALACFAAGKALGRPAWGEIASDTFAQLVDVQTNDGTFLQPTASDNPETWWFHELVLLHAAASYAAQARDQAVGAAVKRAAEYHLRETQPDHATSQPWGLLAFILNPKTSLLADQLLHGVSIHGFGRYDGITSFLLADVLYCLRLAL